MSRTLALLLLLAAACGEKPGAAAPHAQGDGSAAPAAAATGGAARVIAQPLKRPADFANIKDRAEQSRALFVEASRVLTHPRCMNCHSPGGPRQGDDNHFHVPPVVAG